MASKPAMRVGIREPEKWTRRPISLRHSAKGTARFFCLRLRDVHQSLAQPRVTQWRSPKFLFRPIFRLQTIGWTQRPQTGASRQAELSHGRHCPACRSSTGKLHFNKTMACSALLM